MTHSKRHARMSQRLASFARDGRLLKRLIAASVRPYQPIMAHVVVTRRCNLSCGYCHEYDRSSPPVSFEALTERIDHLARLDTIFVTLTGGEPLLHPDIVELVAYIRRRGMVPVMNSNGYLLTRNRIEALSGAGLFALQLSIDNIKPNDTTKKSLKPLRPKLRLLADHAAFRVRVNTVLGSSEPEEALVVAREIMAYGFDAKCSIVRDELGRVMPMNAAATDVYNEIDNLGRRSPMYLSEDFQVELMRNGELDWKCRAGARYFTVCERGRVHLCESSHGSPGKKLSEYDETDIRRAFNTRKACARTCAVAYAHQASRLDAWRAQTSEPERVDKGCWRASEHGPEQRRRLPVAA